MIKYSTDSNYLGIVLALARKHKGVTQVELASKIGISKSCVYMAESGDLCPSMRVLDKYATYLGIPTSNLLWMAEQMRNTHLRIPRGNREHAEEAVRVRALEEFIMENANLTN